MASNALESRLISVTPALAQDWLELNTHNRNVSQSTVDRYASDMAHGRWRHPTGETIIFDSLGRLQEGQHRLLAVIKSGKTIDFIVVTGADPHDFVVIDSGLKRKASNVLSMQGAPSAHNTASSCRNALLLRDFRHLSWAGLAISPVTSAAVIEFYNQHYQVVDESVRQASAAKQAVRIPLTQYAALAINVKLISAQTQMWEEFHDRVVSGHMLPTDSPVFALRRWAIGNTSNSGGLEQQRRTALITKAWNAYVMDKPVKLLQWRREEMPMPSPVASPY